MLVEGRFWYIFVSISRAKSCMWLEIQSRVVDWLDQPDLLMADIATNRHFPTELAIVFKPLARICLILLIYSRKWYQIWARIEIVWSATKH